MIAFNHYYFTIIIKNVHINIPIYHIFVPIKISFDHIITPFDHNMEKVKKVLLIKSLYNQI